MIEVLFLGFLIGLRHALEADHVAAVASLASAERSVGRIVTHGVVWGIGHSATLLAVGGTVVLLGVAMPEKLATWLELFVGVMLIGLGAWVLIRLARDRIHFHVHRHGDGAVHIHAHSHAAEEGLHDSDPHDPRQHDHDHPPGLPWRSLLVGIMHGMAGSAALLLLTASSFTSAPLGLLYIALFGIGSVVGMAALSAIIALPMRYSGGILSVSRNALQVTIGSATMALGSFMVYELGGVILRF
jgi:ABC-type nickel/cobalt efflux system permease component RcnA